MSTPVALEGVPLEGKWTCRFTSLGWCALGLGAALAAAGLVWRYPGVAGLGIALICLAAFSFLSVLRRAPVAVRRVVSPSEVTRFGQCGATLRIRRSRGFFPDGIEVFEHIAGRPMPIEVPRPRGDRASEVNYPIPTERRGVLAIGPLVVVQRGVAGLAENRASLGGSVQVRVLPRVLPVRGLPAGIRRGQVGADERVEQGGVDLVGLREYVPGDDLRRLHAATSARTGTLMVREDSDPALPHLTVVLDDRAAAYATEDDLEEAVEVAASLAVSAAETGNGVRLLTVCNRIDVEASTRSRLVEARRELVSVLAEVTAVADARESVRIPLGDRDVVAVISGAAAATGPLLSEAARGAAGVLSIVDGAEGGGVQAVDQVTVLRAGSSGGVLRLWDQVVAS